MLTSGRLLPTIFRWIVEPKLEGSIRSRPPRARLRALLLELLLAFGIQNRYRLIVLLRYRSNKRAATRCISEIRSRRVPAP